MSSIRWISLLVGGKNVRQNIKKGNFNYDNKLISNEEFSLSLYHLQDWPQNRAALKLKETKHDMKIKVKSASVDKE